MDAQLTRAYETSADLLRASDAHLREVLGTGGDIEVEAAAARVREMEAAGDPGAEMARQALIDYVVSGAIDCRMEDAERAEEVRIRVGAIAPLLRTQEEVARVADYANGAGSPQAMNELVAEVPSSLWNGNDKALDSLRAMTHHHPDAGMGKLPDQQQGSEMSY